MLSHTQLPSSTGVEHSTRHPCVDMSMTRARTRLRVLSRIVALRRSPSLSTRRRSDCTFCAVAMSLTPQEPFCSPSGEQMVLFGWNWRANLRPYDRSLGAEGRGLHALIWGALLFGIGIRARCVERSRRRLVTAVQRQKVWDRGRFPRRHRRSRGSQARHGPRGALRSSRREQRREPLPVRAPGHGRPTRRDQATP